MLRSVLVHRKLRVSFATMLMAGLQAGSTLAPADAAPGHAGPAGLTALADVPGPYISAWGGRSGSALGTIWVEASLDSPDLESFVGQPVVLQQLTGGAWSDRATTPVTLDGPVRFSFPEPAAITVRVAFPAAGLVSPEMALPGVPALGRSRNYVRSHGKGADGGGLIVRVFEDGTTYGISYGGMEYSCQAGSLANGQLTLTTFDFGGGTVTLPATGTWRHLRIRDKPSKAVRGARKSLTGKNRKYLKLCSAPTYASVSTDPADATDQRS